MTDELERIRAAYNERTEKKLDDRYALTRPGELYMLQRREAETLRLLRRAGVNPAKVRVLEVGCGRGNRLMDWMRWGAKPENLFGIDLMEDFVIEAKQSLPAAHLTAGSAEKLDYPDGYFDVVMQSTVFTSIFDESLCTRIANEMQRVCRPDGIILWYDFRYPVPWNKNVRPMRLDDVRRYFGGWVLDSKLVTLLPPIARVLARLSFTLCRMIEFLPFLRSHYLIVMKRKDDSRA